MSLYRKLSTAVRFMRHAFLICAHNNFEILKRLIVQLDYPSFDCFVHIDRKVGKIYPEEFTKLAKNSKVIFLSDRINVKWGCVSQINATFSLLEKAMETDNYDYLHLISGVDFPIKSNKYIYNFFKKNAGHEFVGFAKWTPMMDYKMGIYHFFSYDLQKKCRMIYHLNRWIEWAQKKIGIKYYSDTKKLSKGCNWWSITGDFARELLQNKNKLLKDFKYSHCGDEIFLHTFIRNHPVFRKRIYNEIDEYAGCLRLVDWERGHPYVWKKGNFDEIMSSEALFARKFDSSDMDIISLIQKEIK